MNKELENAIKIIEEAGGFVMMQGNLEDEEMPLTEAQMEAFEAQAKSAMDDYLERKKEAYRRFDKLYDKGVFTYEEFDDICYEEGIEADEIENWIHNQF